MCPLDQLFNGKTFFPCLCLIITFVLVIQKIQTLENSIKQMLGLTITCIIWISQWPSKHKCMGGIYFNHCLRHQEHLPQTFTFIAGFATTVKIKNTPTPWLIQTDCLLVSLWKQVQLICCTWWLKWIWNMECIFNFSIGFMLVNSWFLLLMYRQVHTRYRWVNTWQH